MTEETATVEAPRDRERELLRPFLPESCRKAQDALLGTVREMEYGVLVVSDRGVAHSKLAWWGSELAMLMEGQPRHPSTRALHEAAPVERLDGGELTELVEGLRMCIEGRIYNDDDELLLHCWRRDGALSLCLARLGGADTEDDLHLARDTGLGRGLARVMTRFDEDRAGGRCWLPEERLQQAGTDARSALEQGLDRQTRKQLFAPMFDWAMARLGPALGRMPTSRHPEALTAPALLAAGARRGLLRARRRGFRKLEGRHEQGPGGGLLTLWRTAGRMRRAAAGRTRPGSARDAQNQQENTE